MAQVNDCRSDVSPVNNSDSDSDSIDSNQECKIGYKNFTNGVSQCLANIRKLENRRSSERLRSFKPSNSDNHSPGPAIREISL